MVEAGGIAHEALKSFIERVERLAVEKQAISDDIKDIYAEAKSTGFDPKIMKQVVKLRKMDEHKRNEEEALLDVYKDAVGMTPLEEYATQSLDQAYKPKETADKVDENTMRQTVSDAYFPPLEEDNHISTSETDDGTLVIKLTPKEDLFDRAVEIIFKDNKCSSSYLQRQLKIGYNRAASIVDQLQNKKYVSTADKVGKRTVNQTARKRFNKLLNDGKAAAE